MEFPIEQKSVLSDICHDTGIEASNTKTAGESETYKDGLSETDQVHNDVTEHQLEGCSDTQQDHDELSETVPKKGIYPDLDLCKENTPYQNDTDLNENLNESSKMGCISSKESCEEVENDLPYCKVKSDASLNDALQNNAVEEHELMENQEVQAACRHKEPVGLSSPIVSSFSPRQYAKSDTDELSDSYRTETDVNVTVIADNEGKTLHRSSEKHFPGKAVRVEDTSTYSNEVDEHIKGRKSHATKEKKGRHGHDNTADTETDKTEVRQFRGIDQKWKTNDDDEWEKAHEKYEYFWKADTIYSQWNYSVFFDDNYKFTCAEQYMMYQKAVLFGDCRIMNKVLNTDSPRKMKSLGRKVNGFSDEIWNANCLDIVKQANIAKFSQNKHLKKKLFHTYPKILVEASPVDAIWGIGCTEDDPDAWDESTWRGTNYLGYVITEVRDELLADEGIISHEDKKVYLPGLKEKMQRSNKRVNNPEGGDAVNERVSNTDEDSHFTQVNNSFEEETGLKETVTNSDEGTDVDARVNNPEEETVVKEKVNNIEEEGQFREGVNTLEGGTEATEENSSLGVEKEVEEGINSLEHGAEAKEEINSLEGGTETKEKINTLEHGPETKERVSSSNEETQFSEKANTPEGVTKVKEKADYFGAGTQV